MHRLVPALLRQMGDAYPELGRAQALITETLQLEEVRFRKTLERGLGLLAEESESLTKGDVFSGDVAFRLYDTYGFPLDLTQDALRARDIGVDTDAFNAAMDRQKAEARKAWKGSGDAATEAVWFEIQDAVGVTEFLGYDTESAEGVIVAAVKDGAQVTTLKPGDEASLILNQTPFYAESGGQVGDRGTIRIGQTTLFDVTDTQKKLDGLFVHTGVVQEGTLEVGSAVVLHVDHARRSAIRANHSATHLLHEALRQVLGLHVAQKGSLVLPDRLRFDFSHPKPIDGDELFEIQRLANQVIAQNDPVVTRLMTYDDAVETGAMALFGEKYGDEVRVVSMGAPDTSGNSNKPWSIELCGGTHVNRTGDIGLVHVVAESASAAGVRRIEAVTGHGARAYLAEQDQRVRALTGLLRVRADDVVARVNTLAEERRALERQLADAKRQLALGGGQSVGPAGGADDAVKDINGTRFLARTVEGLNPKDLRGLIDESKKQIGSGVVAIVGVTEDGRAGLAVGVTEDVTSRFSAIDLVRIGAGVLGGKGGGGRPDMAQAGGPDGAKAADALAAIGAALQA